MIVTGWISSAVFASLAFAGSVKAEVIDLGAGETSARLITGVLDFGKPLPKRENGQDIPQAEISLASFKPSRRAVHGTAETEELVLSVGSQYLRNPGLRAAGLSGTEWLALFRANIAVESGFNSEARSPVGAIGLGQLMPGTADILGVDPYDPSENLHGSARYPLAQLQRFGAADLALAAYNAGPEAVTQYGGVLPYAETQGHVSKVLAIYTSTLGTE